MPFLAVVFLLLLLFIYYFFLQATHTPGSEVGGASADDAMNLTTINQDLRQAYGKLAKLKGVNLVFMV